MVLNAGISRAGVNWSGIAKGLGSVGTFLGGLGSLFGASGGTSVKDSKALMSYQEGLQEKYLKHYYSNARQSLNDAGYNPMLAYMNTVSGGQTSAVATEGNEVGQRAQAVANIIQQKIADAQIKNTNANTVKQLEQVNTEQSVQKLNTAMAMATNKKLPYEIRVLASQNIRNILEGESAVTSANALKTRADVERVIAPYEAVTHRLEQRANVKRRSAEAHAFGVGVSTSGVYGKY